VGFLRLRPWDVFQRHCGRHDGFHDKGPIRIGRKP